jgi:hypothetical protein
VKIRAKKKVKGRVKKEKKLWLPEVCASLAKDLTDSIKGGLKVFYIIFL